MAWQFVLIFGASFLAGFAIAALLASLTDVALVPGPRWRDPERWLGSDRSAEPFRSLPAFVSALPAADVTSCRASYWSTHVARRAGETPSRRSALV